MPPTSSPKKSTILAIGLDKPTRDVIAAAAAKGVKVSSSYVELLKKELRDGGAKTGGKKSSTSSKGAKKSSAGSKQKATKRAASSSDHATKSSAGSKAPPTKTGFILARPTMTPKAVVAEAQAAGISLSAKYVSVIRSKAKARGGNGAAKSATKSRGSVASQGSATKNAAAKHSQGASVQAKPQSRPTTGYEPRPSGSRAEQKALVETALRLGIDRAIDILEGVKKSLAPYVN